MAKKTLNFTVEPKDNGKNWTISDSNEKPAEETRINVQNNIHTIVLKYTLTQASTADWKFAENGTLFVHAQDNFNYQLDSETHSNGHELTVNITAIQTGATIPEEVLHLMLENPNTALKVDLSDKTEYAVDFRIVAKKAGDAAEVRHFSQDPRVVIIDVEVPH
ncbi:hypothetical protein [Pseudoalteromonas sp. MMG005]|uniref:hypothetical protein n=1 Tax=Pseudoalteromonas sp. MMG005 TaxID=2822682 RepID=UPI001B39D0EB|nr:hypothetical protein [Pseudoalteromonas sp. MMG005]MBQ4848082.1 hypothetical protein [Pseudoalteromonas sp. MMG005]